LLKKITREVIMNRIVMTLGLAGSLAVAGIALEPVAHATSTTGRLSSFSSNTLANTDAAVNAQNVVNPAQLTSTQIVQIQNALNNAGFSVVDTGRWDPATAAAVQQFQTSRTLVSNGHLTNQTLANLGVSVDVAGTTFGASGGASTTASASGTFNPNSLTAAQVSKVQQALRNRGFNVAVNGIMGPSTIAAIQQFDVSQGRTSSGTLTEQTVADLGVNLNNSTTFGTGATLNTIAPAAGGTFTTNTSIGTTSTGQATPGTSTGTTFPSFGPPVGTITTPGTFAPSANTFPPSANTTTTGTTNTGVMGNTTGGAMGATP
jgi:peptidoglycan hydrolase-like protein with peptidoglycan-binding domain